MRLLLVAHNFPSRWRAGVETYTLGLGRALAARGIDVSVLYPVLSKDVGDAPELDTSAELGLPVHRLHTHAGDPYGLAVTNEPIEALFRDLLDRERIELVHVQHTWIGLPMSLPRVAREAGRPVCMTVHDFWLACARTHLFVDEQERLCDGPESAEGCATCVLRGAQPSEAANAMFALRRSAGLAALDACDRVTVPSRYVLGRLRDFGFERPIEVRGLGIDVPARSASTRIADGGLVLGFIGGLSPLKGARELVRAYHAVPGPGELRLFGPEGAVPASGLLASVDHDPRIRYHGSFEAADLPGILAGIDALVVPSRIETFSLATREALAAGVPVIAARVGALPEAVEDGVDGRLYAPGDPAALARVLTELREDPSRLATLRTNPLTVRTLDEDAAEWAATYSDLLPARAGPGPLAVREAGAECSVVVPVYNRCDLTRACVETLLDQPARRPYELIVVDDGSQDETASVLAAFGDRIRVERLPRNGGYAGACNAGARVARTDRIVFLNNDTQPRPGWLDVLLDEMDTDPAIAAVGSKLLFPDGTVQHAGVAFSKLHASPYHVLAGLPSDDPRVNRRRVLRAVTGACMLIRRDRFEALGGFDLAYRNGFEDVDLCLRLGQSGGRIVVQPRSVLVHLESQSPGRHAHEEANLQLYRERWDDPLRSDEDLVLAGDELAAVPIGERRTRLVPYAQAGLGDWGAVVEAQRASLLGDLPAIGRLCLDPGRWPRNEHLLGWAAMLCARAVGPDAARAFLESIRSDAPAPGPAPAAEPQRPPAPDLAPAPAQPLQNLAGRGVEALLASI